MGFNTGVTNWHGLTVWLVGASTGIGRATASALHARGAKVVVSARNQAALDAFVAGHPGAIALPLDAADPAAVSAAAQTLIAQHGLDRVMYCAGYYTEQRATAYNLPEMVKHQQVNYLGALYLLDAVLPHLLARAKTQADGLCHISLVSSVAGFSGLPKSLAYGPTKAALINLAETLYMDLQDAGIGVSVINPGFVETPLTAQNDFKMPALLTPEQAASAIVQGWTDGDFDIHFPKRFTRWLKFMRLLPYGLYFPLTRKFTGL